MIGWIVFALVALAWLAVAVWQAVRYVAKDMLDFWRNQQDYEPDQFHSALWAGFLLGLAWPVVVPARLVGDLLWNWTYAYARRVYDALDEEPRPDLTVTDELAAIKPRAVAAGGYDIGAPDQVRREGTAHGLDDTAIGAIPPYQARHA